jgi:hypothetical protein
MSVSAAITVNQILTRVAVEAGLDATPDAFSSSDKHYIQLKSLLQTACEDLCLAHPWEFLTRKLSITTIAGENTYSLPEDFLHFVDETGWDTTTDQPIYLISPQQWRAIEAGDIDLIDYGFRIMGGQISFLKHNMPADIVLDFEYISKNFVISGEPPNAPTDSFVRGADLILFDRTLITRYLKALWYEAKGLDSQRAQDTFAQVFDMLIGKDKGGETLSAGGRRGCRLIDNNNIPDTGYGR